MYRGKFLAPAFIETTSKAAVEQEVFLSQASADTSARDQSPTRGH
jgi:hypothetical protein